MDQTAASTKPAKRGIAAAFAGALLPRSSSFTEDTYLLSTLKPSEQTALQDLKQLLSSGEPISIWGVTISGAAAEDERADVVLLKFLRARDFSAARAHAMLLRSAAWRSAFGVDRLAEGAEDLGFKELRGVVSYLHGVDREGRPVCYNAYGIFKDKEMYERVFGDDEKIQGFLRWRIGVMEEGVRMLHLRPGGLNSIIQVTDLKDMPKRALRGASNQILSLFQDNYPELVARKVFINVPWYFSVVYSLLSHFLTDRTKSKFVVARGDNVAETLYRFIRPEFVPVQYGGLSRPGDPAPPRPASEFSIKGGEKVHLEIEGIEGGATITWDLVVGGWDVDYGAEFVPSAAGGYTTAVEKPRRIAGAAEEAVHNSFAAREAGKLVISVDNSASRRRKVAAYRYFVRKPAAAAAV